MSHGARKQCETVVCLFIRTKKPKKKKSRRGKECSSPVCASRILSFSISMDLWSVAVSFGFEGGRD